MYIYACDIFKYVNMKISKQTDDETIIQFYLIISKIYILRNLIT